jgi:hypothetical protein
MAESQPNTWPLMCRAGTKGPGFEKGSGVSKTFQVSMPVGGEIESAEDVRRGQKGGDAWGIAHPGPGVENGTVRVSDPVGRHP